MRCFRIARLWGILAGLAAASATVTPGAGQGVAEPAPFVSRQLTPKGEYPKGIEGPAVDKQGALYVVNFGNVGTIGRLEPGAKKSVLFAQLMNGSIGNGIRFDRQGRMYVADYEKHTIWVIEPGTAKPREYFKSQAFNQPNDLAIAADGTLYASDPRFKKKTGQVWRITRGADGKASGAVMASERKMGVTNGIDLSPDEKTLYVSESRTNEIWAYTLEGAKLVAARLVKGFDGPKGTELDGLRTDADGKIFVARNGNGTIAVVAPDGALVREVAVLGKGPTNLAFGGPDGKTVFVTQGAGGFIEAFRVERPGREFCLQREPAAC